MHTLKLQNQSQLVFKILTLIVKKVNWCPNTVVCVHIVFDFFGRPPLLIDVGGKSTRKIGSDIFSILMMSSLYGIQQVYVANFDWYCYENWFWGLTCFNILSAYNIWYAICVDVDILPIWMWFVFASFKGIATEMHHVQLPQVDLSNCEIFIGASLQMFDAVFRNSHTTYYTLMLFSEIPILHAHRYNLICTRMHILIAFHQ